MTHREVMQMALNTLDATYHKDLHDDKLLTKVVDAKIALREALAQPEPEPVIAVVNASDDYHAAIKWTLNPCPIGTDLYLAPPAQKVPKGWKLVPIEPTLEMIGAAEDQADCLGDFYRAMLAAAPEYKERTNDIP